MSHEQQRHSFNEAKIAALERLLFGYMKAVSGLPSALQNLKVYEDIVQQLCTTNGVTVFKEDTEQFRVLEKHINQLPTG